MSFWRDLLGDIKRIAMVQDDVRRLDVQVQKIDDRLSQQGERIARLEGMVGWVRPTGSTRPPRLPDR